MKKGMAVIAVLLAGCLPPAGGRAMGGPVSEPGGPRYINPGTLAALDGFTHAVKVGLTIYVSGEVALDSTGQLVGPGDLRAQARQAFANLRGVLQAAGGDVANLMKITTYITKLEDFPAVAEARTATFKGELPASTLIVVKALFHPDFLIEVEGVAAV